MCFFFHRLRRHYGLAAAKKIDFLGFPREIRDQIYGYCLVSHAKALHPWMHPSIYRGWKDKPTTELFRVSKQVRHEAAIVFYSQNQLDFTMVEPDEITGFLKRIGRNAEHIRHLVVKFPYFRSLQLEELGRVAIRPRYAGIPQAIRAGCPNLQTITTSRWSTYAVVLWQVPRSYSWERDRAGDRKIVTEAIDVADAYFRSMAPSLKEIIIELDTEQYWWPLSQRHIDRGMSDEDLLHRHVRQQMESHGWKLLPTDRSHDEEDTGLHMSWVRRESRIFMLSESTPVNHRDEYFRSLF
ncbi:hypothetical protein PG997_010857 [Apiospora hydei]|uniref:Uncharacterized protein n=1 Tax=Apiospora hydei TaxID=1337664 RepID=A0ABR1VL36_9PEZI